LFGLGLQSWLERKLMVTLMFAFKDLLAVTMIRLQEVLT
jgi:hypothetical protein